MAERRELVNHRSNMVTLFLNLALASVVVIAAWKRHRRVAKERRQLGEGMPWRALVAIWWVAVFTVVVAGVSWWESSNTDERVETLQSEVDKLKPKPIEKRFAEFLDSIDRRILDNFVSGQTNFKVLLNPKLARELDQLLGDPGITNFAKVEITATALTDEGPVKEAVFQLSPTWQVQRTNSTAFLKVDISK